MNDKGPFAFVCFEDSDGVSGDDAAKRAVEEMHEKVVGGVENLTNVTAAEYEEQVSQGGVKKLYVSFHRKKQQYEKFKHNNEVARQRQLERNTLFVKNYPKDFNEDNLRQLFGAHGEVTNIRLQRLEKSEHAMVEFATHMDASNAKRMTEDEVVAGRNLQVKFYESKFLRK